MRQRGRGSLLQLRTARRNSAPDIAVLARYGVADADSGERVRGGEEIREVELRIDHDLALAVDEAVLALLLVAYSDCGKSAGKLVGKVELWTDHELSGLIDEAVFAAY